MDPAPRERTWLNADQAAAHAHRARQLLSAGAAAVTERTIRSWVNRGHLEHKGLDDDGRQLFALADVAAAELATRDRALRLVGIGAPAEPTPDHSYGSGAEGTAAREHPAL